MLYFNSLVCSVTQDPEFMAMERQFKDLTKHAERLQGDAETYRDGVAGKLDMTATLKMMILK